MSEPGAAELEPGQLPDGIKTSMKRSRELIGVDDEVQRLESQLKRARLELEQKKAELKQKKAEKERIQVLASLRHVGRAETWRNLAETDLGQAWKKETLLAILSCEKNDGGLPIELQEEAWNDFLRPESGKSRELSFDPDVFLARSRRRDFLRYYKSVANRDCLVKFLERWLDDLLFMKKSSMAYSEEKKQTVNRAMVRIVGSFPSLFSRLYKPTMRCDDKDILLSFLNNNEDVSKESETAASSSKSCCGLSLQEIIDKITLDLLYEHDVLLSICQKFPSALDLIKISEVATCIEFARKLVKRLGNKVGDGFKYFSLEVRDDPITASMYCNANAKSYPYVSFKLRSSRKDLAVKASFTEPSILLSSVPGNIERRLLSSKRFVASLFSHTRKIKPGILVQLYDVLAPSLKRDTDIHGMAMQLGVIPFERDFQNGLRSSWKSVDTWINEQPSEQLFDPVWWRQVLAKNPEAWSRCPFIHDIEFVEDLPFPLQHRKEAFDLHPSLLSHVGFWRRLLEQMKSCPWELKDAFDESPPSENVLNDKQTMLLACSIKYCGAPIAYDMLEKRLQLDRDIIQTVLSNSATTALSLDQAKSMWKVECDFFEPSLALLSNDNLDEMLDDDDIYDCLRGQLSEAEIGSKDSALAKLSIERGTGVADGMAPYFADEDFLLLVAEYAEKDFGEVCAAELWKDKDFMLQVLEKNGSHYRHVDSDLQHDYDIVLMAWSSSVEVGDVFWTRDEYRFVADFANQVREKLIQHDIFLRTILYGMSSRSTSPLKTILANQGQETSTSFKKQLAEFLDIPTGKELGMLRSASRNLQSWGY